MADCFILNRANYHLYVVIDIMQKLYIHINTYLLNAENNKVFIT